MEHLLITLDNYAQLLKTARLEFLVFAVDHKKVCLFLFSHKHPLTRLYKAFTNDESCQPAERARRSFG
jgi:hypothetical protein